MAQENFIPKYQKIIEDFHRSIASGLLVAGTKLPVREELMLKYGVTRATINRAISELLRDGLLIAKPRLGTFVADSHSKSGKVAVVLHSPLVMLNKSDWTNAANYYAMFGKLLELLPEEKREILNLDDVRKNPKILSGYQRILWNNLAVEDFENAVNTVGDRSCFLLLNRYYEDCNFVSINHRQAAFDLAELFLVNLPMDTCVGLLDMPYGRYLSNRFVWLERRAGFMDACEKYNRFCRVIELKQGDYNYNIEQIEDFDSLKGANSKGLILSPSNETTGFMLGFLHSNNYRLNHDYFYGDFDNENSLEQYGVAIPSILEDYAKLAELAYENLAAKKCRLWCSYSIVNSPF